MKKHTTTAGPTGLARIRSLVAFRHQNPVARFISTLLAFAIAMLLVVGTGAAYADDGTDPSATPTDGTTAAADPTPADATTPAADSSDADTASAPDSESAAPSGGGDNAATSSSSGETTTSSSTPRAVSKSTTSFSNALQVVAGLAVTVPCTGGPAPVVGGFEIDGNLCAQGNLDWSNAGQSVEDGFGDSTTFHGGTAEGDDPAGWTLGGPAPNGKTDIGTAWAYSQVSNGTVYGFFGLTNDSTSGGTSQYDLEYNQLNPTAGGMPNRSPGDLLFRFSSTGSDPITFTDAKKWVLKTDAAWDAAKCEPITATAGWCTIPIPPMAFTQRVTSDGIFFEGAINISLFFGNGTCSGTFGSVSVRSVTGNSFYSSTLKDYVAPLAVNTPSTCGKIIINKKDENGNSLGGATFSVSPNPIPGVANATPYSITDNDSKDKNPAAGIIEISPVDPGESYTVTETGSPTGYMIDNPLGTSTNPQTVGASETKTFNFVDHHIWKGLTATKTANPTYTAAYGWSILKEIGATANGPWLADTTPGAPLVKTVTAGSPDTLYYRVTATEGARTTSLYKVSGTITVNNPADNVGAMNAVVTDDLPGATCLVDGLASKSISVAKGGSTPVPYVCTFAGTPTAGQLSGTNTAHVTWDRSDYPQVVGDLTDVGGATRHVDPTAAYDFANADVTEVNKTVTVTDNQHTFSPAWTITWTGQGVTDSKSYSHDVAVPAGSCSAVFSNTATITGDNNANLGSDSAHGKVCEGADLTITRIDAETLTRTYPWSIEKKTTTPKIVMSGGKATADYEVTVTAGDGADSAWNISGTITVHNPNDWESVDVTSLPVSYTGGGTCAVTGESFPVTLAASGQHAFAYSCNFNSKPDYSGTINATVNWNAAAASTPNGSAQDGLAITEANWVKTLVNDTVTVVDDHATPGDTSDDTEWNLDWATVHAMAGHQQTLTYSTDLAVPDGGTCATRTNTVKIVGDGGVILDADQNAANNSANVQVCNPLGLSVTKTAVGDFTRTYDWSIEKFINDDQTSQTVHIDTFDHTFSYKVKVTPGAAVDSAWVVSGTITVTNDNTDTDIDPIQLTSVSDLPNIGSAGNCTYSAPVFPYAIDSGDSVNVPYECTFANQPTKPYGGTNTATATWGQTGSATSPAVPVTWHDPAEIDKSIDVFDNKVDLDPAVKLGTVDWNANGTSTVFDYTKNLSVPQSTAGSCGPDMVNTAWLGGTAEQQSDRKDSTTAVICVNAGTWTVSKVNVDGDGPIPTDSDVTYQLTAHKTGGSNPKNVVLHDDLSDIAPYITGDPTFSVPAGTTAVYDPATHVLTWTIAELGETDRTLDFTVHVKADAYGVDLPNLVTSPGSDNCPNADVATAACKTDNDTPHFTLEKSSDAGAQVLPPYLGDPGTLITYTLTVHNDSDAPINATTLPGATVTDNLSDVLDNATWVGNITPAGQAERAGDTLTWTLPEIPVDGTATLTYQVRVAGDQWDETLTNVATPGNGGDCLPSEVVLALVALDNANCTTTTVTPPYTQIQALKVDSDTGKPLQGAEFTLFHGDDAIDTATSDANGIALFGTKLQPGDFTVQETKAPTGYDLPTGGGDVVHVTIDEPDAEDSNFVENGVMAPITFADPPQGALTFAKAHFERNASNAWVPSDGQVDFGDEIRYVMTVTATGPKIFHDTDVTDYVPGYNPADTTTAPAGTKGELEAGSITCGGAFTCTTSYDAGTGKITWHLTSAGQAAGDVQGDGVGTVEFVVRMPNLPATSPLAGPGVSFAAALWNQAALAWDQYPSGGHELVHHQVLSNEVTDAANATLPPQVVQVSTPHPHVLPNTGGPDAWLLAAGLLLLLGGGALVATDRRRRHRS